MAVTGWIWRAALVVAAGGLLAGCEVHATFTGSCVPNPPVPNQTAGTLDVTVDIPPNVAAGQTFTITVKNMTGYAGAPSDGAGGEFPHGVIWVTGPVSPSGYFDVGPGFSGPPYPTVLTFQATGEPGDVITIGALQASSNYFADSGPVQHFEITCFGGNEADNVIGTATIVAPAAAPG